MDKDLSIKVNYTKKDYREYFFRIYFIDNPLKLIGYFIVLGVALFSIFSGSTSNVLSLLALMILLYIPFNYIIRVNMAMTSLMRSAYYHFTISNEGIRIIHEYDNQTVGWNSVRQVKEFKGNLAFYMDKNNPFIIPKREIGEDLDRLRVTLKEFGKLA